MRSSDRAHHRSVLRKGITISSVALIFTGLRIMAAENASQDVPSLALVMTVKATIEQAIEMGKTPEGQRRVIPISGGTVEGPSIKGTIMPGGEDWQLVREDGTMQLDARYWLRTDDGAIIRVNNAVIISTQAGADQKSQTRYARSSVKFEAPEGKYEWLNKAVFVGTIRADTTQRPAVVTLQFYKVD